MRAPDDRTNWRNGPLHWQLIDNAGAEMIGDFDTILNLVGTLDDAPGEDAARERFRKYLATGLTELGVVRDAVQTCVTHSGPQYARALQDLVNYIGTLMGFEVEYGRYAGVTNRIGHDGLWRSGSHVVVVEVKTTDAYAINTATLLDYINRLRSEGTIGAEDQALGLYVYARVDPNVKQLEHAIVAERRTQELRVGSVDSVLSLAELIRQELIGHDEALAILWPSGVWIDGAVRLLARVAAGSANGIKDDPADTGNPVVASSSSDGGEPVEKEPLHLQSALSNTPTSHHAHRAFYLTPVTDIPSESARETLERLLPAGVYAFGENTPNRKRLKVGDRIAFYQSTVGVVAYAHVASAPERNPRPDLVKEPEKYPWTFALEAVHSFLDEPTVIDADLRSRLDAFAGKDHQKSWAWLVQGTQRISEHDFRLLTRLGTE